MVRLFEGLSPQNEIMTMKRAEKNIEKNTDNTAYIAQMCVQSALDKKAHNIVTLEVGDLTSYADYFVICSAPSERQVQAITRNVNDELRKLGFRALGSEGLENSSWVLLDFGSVIFHCFTESAREYYDLEGFWIDANRINFVEK